MRDDQGLKRKTGFATRPLVSQLLELSLPHNRNEPFKITTIRFVLDWRWLPYCERSR